MPSVKTARVNPFSPKGLIFLLVRSLYRFLVSGQSVTGRPTDNASFLHAATKDDRDKPVEKLTGPIWQRLARRWAIAGLPLLFLLFAAVSVPVRFGYGVAGSPVPLPFRLPWVRVAEWWSIATVCALVGFGTVLALSWWKNRAATSEFVYPAWQAACGVMGIAYHKRDARKMVELPEGFEVIEQADEIGARHPLLDKLTFHALSKREAQRLLAEIEQAAEPPPAPEPAEPGTEIEIRKPGPVARWRGRRLDTESQTPVETPEPPPVIIRLLPGKVSTAAAQKLFLAAVTGPLGMPNAKAAWYPRGRKPYVELRPNLLPPPAVSFAQIKRHFEKADLATPVMGLATGNRAISIDLDNNSPHTLISGGSGTGKSVLLKCLLMQRMHNGSGTLMLDYKRVSHRWLHNLPGCVYAWRLADVHDSLIAAGEELNRRLETVLPEDNDVNAEMQTFQPVDVVVEEINSTTKLLQTYWQTQLDGKGPSPAITALMTLVNMGREYRMFVWIAAQRASASVFGANGGDLRESFQTRLMAKWSVQTWKMLAGSAQYQRPEGGRGVWARVQDDEVEIVRVPFVTNDEARAWAMSGTDSPATPDVLPDRLSGPSGRPGSKADNPPDIGPQLVALSAAIRHLPGDAKGKRLTIEGMRTASKRPGFPAPKILGGATRPNLYDLEELIEWRAQQVGEVAELTEAFEQPAAIRDLRRIGRVYAFDTLNPEAGSIEVGYVGQTRRTLKQREAEHRGDKPWADLIIGSIRLVWEGEPTDDELDAIEKRFIGELFPRYNIEYQMGAVHAVPKWEQVDARHARDDALGRPRWVPVDVFSGESRPEIVEDWRREDGETF